MSTMTSEREAFEQSLLTGHSETDAANRTKRGGIYVSDRIQARWEGWQARAHLAQPAQAVDVGEVVGYLVEKKPRVVNDAPARSFYFADQHNPTDPEWWVAGEQKKYSVTPLTRALSGEDKK